MEQFYHSPLETTLQQLGCHRPYSDYAEFPPFPRRRANTDSCFEKVAALFLGSNTTLAQYPFPPVATGLNRHTNAQSRTLSDLRNANHEQQP